MHQNERTSKLLRILMSEGRGVTVDELAATLEVSDVTVKRDLRVLRDRFAAPLKWEAGRGYFLDDSGGGIGPFMLPGVWLESEEIYALLTLYNIVSDLGLNGLATKGGPPALPGRQ